MMTPDELTGLLALKQETRSLEFKSAGAFSDLQLKGKVVRGMIGMANLRDGGVVLVGVDPAGSLLAPVEYEKWRSHDELSGAVAKYADPFIDFEVSAIAPTGHSIEVIVINVKPFATDPVICKKPLQDPGDPKKLLLREGACYIRAHSPVATVEIPNSTYMRELLDLALEQRLRRHLDTTRRAGGVVVPTGDIVEPYERQRAEFGK